VDYRPSRRHLSAKKAIENASRLATRPTAQFHAMKPSLTVVSPSSHKSHRIYNYTTGRHVNLQPISLSLPFSSTLTAVFYWFDLRPSAP
jgi:hypothetical protein